MNDLRSSFAAVVAEEFSDTEEAISSEWIGIEWHSKLHDFDLVGERIQSITLPTCSFIRSICNDTLSDAYYYFGTFFGQKIVNVISKELNWEHAKFMKKHPTFKGPICIFAHSLGSVISYDLLANQDRSFASPFRNPKFPQEIPHTEIQYPRIKFKVDYLFCVGSPLPAVFVQRGQSFSSYPLPAHTKYFNIFNLYDPVAYRIEPLIDSRYLEISPVLLQRPSVQSSKSFEFSYYKEMIYAYMPNLSLSNIPKMDLPSFSQLPDLGITSSLLGATSRFIDLQQRSASFPFMVSMPTLPQIPILSNARNMFETQVSKMLQTVWGIEENDDGARIGDKRHLEESDDWRPTKKRREIEDSQDVITSSRKRVTRSSSKQAVDSDPPKRIIKAAVSQIHKKDGDAPPTTTNIMEANQRILSYISKFFTLHEEKEAGSPSTTSPSLTSVKERRESAIKHDVDDLGEQLTKELIAAAHEAERNMEEEAKSWTHDQKPLHRYDYFVTKETIDSVVHQYMLGLSAHFNYWLDKDIMYFMIKTIKENEEKKSF